MTLLRGADVVGLPVVTACCGEDVAQVRAIVTSAVDRRLIGFSLAKRGLLHGRLKESLSADQIGAVGPAAVIITSCDHLTAKADAEPELASPSKSEGVMGVPVLGEDGGAIGRISDVVFRSGPGAQLVGFVLAADEPAERFIPAWLNLTSSPEAVIVPQEVATGLHRDLTGFGAAVDEHDRAGGLP